MIRCQKGSRIHNLLTMAKEKAEGHRCLSAFSLPGTTGAGKGCGQRRSLTSLVVCFVKLLFTAEEDRDGECIGGSKVGGYCVHTDPVFVRDLLGRLSLGAVGLYRLDDAFALGGVYRVVRVRRKSVPGVVRVIGILHLIRSYPKQGKHLPLFWRNPELIYVSHHTK